MKKYLLLLLFPVFGCKNDSLPKPTVSISPLEAYNSIINNLDPTFPGRGIDVFNDKKLDRPMAYGLILSSESNKYQYVKDSLVLNRIRICGQWLINNSDLNSNGISGYGLPDSWDAFSDSSINPANNEYTITTAIAIAGLLDWYNVEPDSLKRTEIKHSVLNSLSPYLNETFDSPIGIPSYSLSPQDRKYDVYNPAIYLAGQFQRFSKITEQDSLKTLLNQRSDKIIAITLSNSQTDSKGNINWSYGVQIKKANDLVHACYMAEGIREYSQFGKEINKPWNSIFDHLNLFYLEGRWYEHIEKKYRKDKYNSRLWGFGMLMYSLSKEQEYTKIEQTLWPQILEYHTGNGRFKFKPKDDRIMVRQEVHLLLGLSYYLYNEKTAVNL